MKDMSEKNTTGGIIAKVPVFGWLYCQQ